MNDSRAASVASDRRRLVAVVLAVLISQVMIYPGQEDIIAVLGAPPGIRAGMWFLVAETAAFVAFGVVWGAASDVSGRRVTLAQGGALGGAVSYLLLALAPALGIGFRGALLIRVAGGALTIGAFSLGITMLMDLSGGHGRNMGAAGIAIGLGAAVGAVVGGALADQSPLAPVYAGSAALAGSAVLLWGVDDRAPGTESSAGFGTIVSKLPEVPGLLVPLVFGFVDRLTAGFFSLVGIFYFRDVFGLSASAAGITLALFFLPFALLQYHSGAVSDRTGRFLPIVGGSLGYGVMVISVGVAPVYAVAAGLMVVLGVCGAFMALPRWHS
jgi:Major Facilitator Superfamily.